MVDKYKGLDIKFYSLSNYSWRIFREDREEDGHTKVTH